MTDAQIKDIFSRFQNLNLLVLIEDLRRGLVANGVWQELDDNLNYNKLCPIAHGWRGSIDLVVCDEIFEFAGLTSEKAEPFTQWWDGNGWMTSRELKSNRQTLLRVLEAIYAERLADADVVQGVCKPQESLHARTA